MSSEGAVTVELPEFAVTWQEWTGNAFPDWRTIVDSFVPQAVVTPVYNPEFLHMVGKIRTSVLGRRPPEIELEAGLSTGKHPDRPMARFTCGPVRGVLTRWKR